MTPFRKTDRLSSVFTGTPECAHVLAHVETARMDPRVCQSSQNIHESVIRGVVRIGNHR